MTKDNKRLQSKYYYAEYLLCIVYCSEVWLNFVVFLCVDDLSDLEKQLTEGGASVHDLEKAKKKLQQELEELNLLMEVSQKLSSLL